jgi:hypothetical protein
MDKKTSQFGTITAIQAESAGTEGYIPYVDPSQVDPDLRNKRMTRSEAKKFFGMQFFTALSGTSWDGSNKTLTLTSNTALTFSSTRRNGILRVKQDGTGSRTLSINSVSVPVSSGANTITVISFFYDDVAALYVFSYDTNILGNVGGGLTQLSTPGSFTAVAASSSEIDLSWADVANETGYDIYFNGINDLGSAGLLVSKPANSTSHAHTGLGASSLLYYWIIAKGDGVTYSDSNPAPTSATSLSGGGGGSFTAASRVAFYRNTDKTVSGTDVTKWANADGNTAYDFNQSVGDTMPQDDGTNGLSFDGSAGRKLFTASVNNITAPVTIYVRMKLNADSAIGDVLGSFYQILFQSGHVYFNPNGSGYADFTYGLATGSFKTVVISWDGTNPPKLYVDGSLVATAGGTPSGTTYTVFGVNAEAAGAAFNGNLLGMAVFSVAHDATTIGTQTSLFNTAVA